jgi:hypothetical protein
MQLRYASGLQHYVAILSSATGRSLGPPVTGVLHSPRSRPARLSLRGRSTGSRP